MTGFIDLLFKHDGRYYILDWKTNIINARAEDFDAAGVRWNSGDRASGTYNYNPNDYFCLTYRGDRCNYALTYCSRTYSALNVIHRKLTDIIVDNRLEAN